LLNKDPNLFDKNTLNKIFYKNLKEYFLPNGTVIFQAFTWSFIKKKKFHPLFNSPDIGSFEKYVFNKPGVARSSHPTNSIIVFGKNKNFVSKNHGLYSFGANSPFEKFKDLNLKFVNIGVPLENSCTYIHHLEHINGTNHRFNKLINGKVFVHNKYLRKNFYILVKYRNISNAVDRNEKKFFDYLRKKKKLKSLKVNQVLFSVMSIVKMFIIVA
jgi:aminoglycoside N3'-acetyltransferase